MLLQEGLQESWCCCTLLLGAAWVCCCYMLLRLLQWGCQLHALQHQLGRSQCCTAAGLGARDLLLQLYLKQHHRRHCCHGLQQHPAQQAWHHCQWPLLLLLLLPLLVLMIQVVAAHQPERPQEPYQPYQQQQQQRLARSPCCQFAVMAVCHVQQHFLLPLLLLSLQQTLLFWLLPLLLRVLRGLPGELPRRSSQGLLLQQHVLTC